MGKTRETFTSPVGRLVQGDCFEPQTKDQQGNLRVVKQGPNAGQPNPTYFIAVAFAKSDVAFGELYAIFDRVARAEWPSLFPNPTGPCVNPMFAFKVVDGDGVDRHGKSQGEKEGFRGHWVVRFASAYPPKVVRPTSPGVWETITDKSMVKRGYYVRVAGSVTGNDNTQNPGIYVNLDMVELVAYGQEIVSGPDAASAFGAPAALPAGASPMPLPGSPMPPATPPVAAPPVMATPPLAAPAGQPLPPPHTGFMAPPGATPPLAAPALPVVSPTLPAPPPMPSAPPATASPTRVMTAAANGQTFEQFVAAGWTEELLIAHGYMVVQ